MRYTIIGGGALGTLIAARLVHHGIDVHLVEQSEARRNRLARGTTVNGYWRGPHTTSPVSGWDGVTDETDALLLCVSPKDVAAALAQATTVFASRPMLVTFASGMAQLRHADTWPNETIVAVSNLEVRLDADGNPETGFHNFTWLGNLQATETDAMRAVQRDLAWFSPTLTTKVIEGMVWSKAVYLIEAALPALTATQPRIFYDNAYHLAVAADLVREGLAVASAHKVTPIAFDFFDPNLYHTATAGERHTLEAWMRHAWQRHEQYRVGAPATFTEPAGAGWSLDPRNPEEELSTLLDELRQAGAAASIATPLLDTFTTLVAEVRRQGPIPASRVVETLSHGVPS